MFSRKFKEKPVEPPSDVKEAFRQYSEGGVNMTAEQLQRFLVNFQGAAAATLADAERVLVQLNSLNSLTLEDFYHYLFSADLNAPIGSLIHQDMNAPLSHYYIYTGHNSYLTGNQLSSDCSDVPIIKALKSGVRVIELDIWPNSLKNDVQVLHGRTLTTPVELITCLKSIREHAFVASPYPLVITLEDHLTPDLQAKVAEMITQTFEDMLFYPETKNFKQLPTPESLKHRILISTKPPKEYLEAEADKRNSSKKGKASEDDTWGEEPSNLKASLGKQDESDSDTGEQNLNPDDCEEREEKVHKSPAYKRLIAIHAGKPKGQLKDALKVESDKVRRLSLSEQKLEKAADSHGGDLVRFTHKNILRVYPKGTRFTSSNYDPLIGWLYGAQMVAFNMQGYGRALWLMHGMFRSNGGCGYVKKPDFLTSTGPDNQVFDPKAALPVKTTLKVKIYMGDGWNMDFKKTHFDLCSPPDFYTKIGIAGAPADETMMKTKVQDDKWKPVWNEELTFPLTVPELALLRIEVHEHDRHEKDDFAGQTCLPVWELRTGIRAVPLYSRKGEKYNSVRLLVRFEFL